MAKLKSKRALFHYGLILCPFGDEVKEALRYFWSNPGAIRNWILKLGLVGWDQRKTEIVFSSKP